MRGDGDNFNDCQDQEVEVLQAMFLSDFEDLRGRDVWKVRRPPEIILHLRPCRGASVHEKAVGADDESRQRGCVDLHVKCSSTYPDTVPEISLRNEQGMSKEDFQSLRTQLTELAESLRGNVMIYALAEYVQQYLFDNCRPAMQSFYQEMLKRQSKDKLHKDVEQEKTVALKLEENLALEAEIKRKQEELRQQAKQLRERKGVSFVEAEEDNRFSLSMDEKVSTPPTSSYAVSRIQFRRPTISTKPLTDERNRKRGTMHCSISGIETTVACSLINETPDAAESSPRPVIMREYLGVCETSGQVILIEEWRIMTSKANVSVDAINQLVADIEQKYHCLLEKLDYKDLLKYVGFSFSFEPKDNVLMIFVAKEYEHALPISSFVSSILYNSPQDDAVCSKFPLPSLRCLCQSVLSSLNYLHSKSVVHRSLDLNAVYQTSDNCFLLTNYWLPYRICELLKSIFGDDRNVFMPFASCRVIAAVGRMNQKSDVYLFGLIALSLITGRDEFLLAARTLPEIPEQLPPVVRTFLSVCLAAAESERLPVSKLLEHPFLRDPVPSTLLRAAQGERGQRLALQTNRKAAEETSEDLNVSLSIPLTASASSRLRSEFDILSFLGSGAFGDVLKVRNKLDGGVYAIKRIRLDPKSKHFNKKITREVQLLSRLNHENVVRYYNSWIEKTTEACPERLFSPPVNVAAGQLLFKHAKNVDEVKRPLDKIASDDIVNLRKVKDPFEDESSVAEGNLSSPSEEGAPLNGHWSVSESAGLQNERPSARRTMTTSDEADEESDDEGSESSSDELLDVFSASSFRRSAVLPSANMLTGKKNALFDKRTSATAGTLSSDDIVFEHSRVNDHTEADGDTSLASSSNTNADNARNALNLTDTDSDQKSGLEPQQEQIVQILYIQMEFCEKSTLRQAIDNAELFADRKRTWRLFREILEGLVYIHSQGTIHRDLKPVNIFLDSTDHIKLGDFGLATQGADLLEAADILNSASLQLSQAESEDQQVTQLAQAVTGRVGTALYISPELASVQSNAYTEKVDLYSLGVICFEMFHAPLGTGMERVKILTNLRKPDVLLPAEFERSKNNEKLVMSKLKHLIKILRQLLCHNPKERPTAKQLLQSGLLPEVDTCELAALALALQDPQSRTYKHTVAALFGQNVSVIQDNIYDAECSKSKNFNVRDHLCATFVKETLTNIFKRHGAVAISTPQLLPKTKLLTENVDNCFQLMDESGLLVTLPYDLRFSFARFIGRQHNILPLKRYCIEKVFRFDVPGFHPREVLESAFDILTRTPNSLPAAAEVLAVISEVIQSLKCLRERRYVIHVNHTSLFKAVLLYSGVEDDSLQLVIAAFLNDSKTLQLRKLEKHERLKSLGLSEQSISTLFTFIDLEGPVAKVNAAMQTITNKRKEKYASMAKQALHELELIISYAQTLGVALPLTISVKLVYNPHEYNGIMWKVVSPPARATSDDTESDPDVICTRVETLAAGGRYEDLICKFQRAPTADQASFPYVAFGVSICLERILNLFSKQEKAERAAMLRHTRGPPESFERPSDIEAYAPALRVCDVIVCFVGNKLLVKEVLGLTKALWHAGINCDYHAEPIRNLEDFMDSLLVVGIEHLVALKDSGTGTSPSVLVKSWDRKAEKQTERKLPLSGNSDIAKHLQSALFANQQQLMRDSSCAMVSASDASLGAKDRQPSALRSSIVPNQGVCTTSPGPQSLAGDLASTAGTSGWNLSNVKIHFAIVERLQSNTKRRYELQIAQSLNHVVQRFAAKETINVVASDLPALAIKTLSTMLELGTSAVAEAALRNLTSDILQKFGGKHKKQLTALLDTVMDLKLGQQNCNIIVLYSVTEDCYRIVI